MVGSSQVGLIQLCVWGEPGDTALMWSRIDLLCRASALRRYITKVQRVQQEDGRHRFDIWIEAAFETGLLERLSQGVERFGWYVRRHIPYIDRVGRGATPAPREAEPADLAPTEEVAPLLVGSLNVHGIRKKKQDVRTLLEESRCEVLGLQETLLNVSDWHLRMPGFHCLTSMGDSIESERGVALMVSTKYNCSPVGKASSYWTCARIYGATLARPFLVGSVYIPHRRGRAKALRTLPLMLAKLHDDYPEDPLVLLGDFNMTLDKLQLETTSWTLPFHVIPNTGGVATRQDRGGSVGKCIDHILYSGVPLTTVATARVLRTWDISDHYPVMGVIPDMKTPSSTRPRPQQPDSIRRRINVADRTTKQDIAQSNYWAPLAALMLEENEFDDDDSVLSDPTDLAIVAHERLETNVERVVSTCHDIASDLNLHQKVTGRAPPRVRRSVKSAIRARRHAFQRLRDAEEGWDDPDALEAATQDHTASILKARRAIRISGRKAWHKIVRTAHANMRHNPHGFWKWASSCAGWQLKSGAAGIQPVYGSDGVLLTDLEAISKAWADHYGGLATDVSGHGQDPEYWKFLDPAPQRAHLEELDVAFTQDDLWASLLKMQSHKAPGGDGIPTELWKAALLERPRENDELREFPRPTPMTNVMLKICNDAFLKGIVVEAWAESIVVSIAKSGDLADTNNYRGISLMATLLKILCVMMGTRLNLVAEAHNLFSRAQAGFRSMEECVTQAAMVLDICQRRRILDLPTFLVFVDLKKAYDMVPHHALFAKLSRAGIRGVFLKFLMALYSVSTIRVRVGGGAHALYSELVRLRRGVRQG